MKVSAHCKRSLRLCYELAKEMRGAYIGHPDPKVISGIDLALRRVKKLIKQMKVKS